MAADGSRHTPSRGKQIVFVFMAATVVVVVVFLCGVFVGRGVPRSGAGGAVTTGATADGYRVYELPPPTLTTPRAEPSAGATASHDLTYPDRLTGSDPVPESVGSLPGVPAGDAGAAAAGAAPSPPPVERAVPMTAVDDVSSPARVEPPQPEASPPSPPVDPGAGGFTVQVSANRGRAAASVVAGQLRSRGFPAFVLEPLPGDPVPFHRVRVGPYETREEARRVRDRLTNEEAMGGAYIAQ